MISPYKLSWMGLSSLDFDCWTELSFEGDSGNTSTFLNRENIITEHYDGRRTIHRAKYQEGLSPTITFIKQNYGDFSQEENRKMLSWLTSSDKPSWLEIYHDDSNSMSYRLFGNWTEVEQYKLANGRVVGYVATFESSAPYAYSHLLKYPADPDNSEIIADYLQVSGANAFTITCGTDEYNKLIYPKVTIIFNGENVYVPINQDPTINQYEMMSNIIYYNKNAKKYYVNIPDYNYKGEVTGIFSSSIEEQTSDASTLGNYYYYPANRTLYKGIQVYELATTFTSGSTYYLDDKGITIANPQPQNEEEIKNGEYYVSTKYGWEAVANIGTGVQIENKYILSGESKHSKTIIVGCKPKANDTYGEEIILDGTNKVASSSLEPMRIIDNDFNWVWVPIAEGENNFIITGNCEVKLEWIEPRKVGSL